MVRGREVSDTSGLARAIQRRYLSFLAVRPIGTKLSRATRFRTWASRRLPLLKAVYQRWPSSGVSSWHSLSPRPHFLLPKIRRRSPASPDANTTIAEGRLEKRSGEYPAKMVASPGGIPAQAALQMAEPIKARGEHIGAWSNPPRRVKGVMLRRTSPVERPEKRPGLVMGRTTMVASSEGSSLPVRSADRPPVLSGEKRSTQTLDRPINSNVEVSPLRQVYRFPNSWGAGAMRPRTALEQIRRYQWSGSGPHPRAAVGKTPGIVPTIPSVGYLGIRVAPGKQGAQGQSDSVTVGAEKGQQVQPGRRNLVGRAILRSNLTAKSTDPGVARQLWKAEDLFGSGSGRIKRSDFGTIPMGTPQLVIAVPQEVAQTKRGRLGDISPRVGLRIERESGEALQYGKVKSRGGLSLRQMKQQHYSWAPGQGSVLWKAESRPGKGVKREHLTTGRLGASSGTGTEHLASEILSRHVSFTTQQAGSWSAASAGRTLDRYGAYGLVLTWPQGRPDPERRSSQKAFGRSTQVRFAAGEPPSWRSGIGGKKLRTFVNNALAVQLLSVHSMWPPVTSTWASPSILVDQRQATAWDMTARRKLRDKELPLSEFFGFHRRLAVQLASRPSARTGKQQGDPFFAGLPAAKARIPASHTFSRIHARVMKAAEPATILLQKAASPIAESPGGAGSAPAMAATDENAPVAGAAHSTEQLSLERLADEIYAILEKRLVVERESLGL
jgi:hypothetical protein